MFLIIVILSICFNLFSMNFYDGGNAVSKYKIAKANYIVNDFFQSERILKQIIANKSYNKGLRNKSLITLFKISEKTDDEILYSYIVKNYKYKENSIDFLNVGLSKYFIKKNKFDNALRYLNLIEKSSSYKNIADIYKSIILINNKKDDKALDALKEVLKRNNLKIKDKNYALLTIARLCMIQKKYNEALVFYQKINEDSNYFIDASKELVDIFFTLNQNLNSIAHLKALMLASKQYKDKDLLELDYFELKEKLAYSYLENSNFEEAKNVFLSINKEAKKRKKEISKILNKIKISDDLKFIKKNNKIIKDLSFDIVFSLYKTDDEFSKIIYSWLSKKEKIKLNNYLNLFYSSLYEVERLKNKDKFFVSKVDVFRKGVHGYWNYLFKEILNRLNKIISDSKKGAYSISFQKRNFYEKKIKQKQNQKDDLIKYLNKKIRLN
jgi:hypothetical protein